MSTRRYLFSKIGQAILTLAFVLAFNFFLFRGLGDPVSLLLHGHASLTPSAIADLKAQLGLDLPLPQQFLHYINETLHGNLGYAYDGTPVSTVIASKAWPTLLLIGLSTIASIVIGIWVGIKQGWKRGTGFDQSMLGVTLVLYSMPEFWFGLLMIMLFAVTFQIFPTGGMTTPGADYTGLKHVADVMNHMALPFFVLTVAYLAEYSIIMRSSLLETLGEDFITTARSKGMMEKRVLYRHAVPNALLPTMTVTILSLGIRDLGGDHDRDHLQLAGPRPRDVQRDPEQGLLHAPGAIPAVQCRRDLREPRRRSSLLVPRSTSESGLT